MQYLLEISVIFQMMDQYRKLMTIASVELEFLVNILVDLPRWNYAWNLLVSLCYPMHSDVMISPKNISVMQIEERK